MVKNSVYLVEKDSVFQLDADHVTVETIGGKALGLCLIPAAWSAPFFIISKDMFAEYILNEDVAIINKYMYNIKSVLETLDIKGRIILRSTAVNEGMKERGRFESVETSVDDIESALGDLLFKLKNIPNNGMPIIVQKLISPVFTGHMSNERRFSQDNRDWKIETYHENDKFDQDTICVRTWRTKYNIVEITNHQLVANSKTFISELQKVAFYWYILSKDLKCRFHLELVFDGYAIYIVQADRSFTKDEAINPKSYDIRIKQALTTWMPNILRRFNPNEASIYKKLQNVKSYNDLGFCTVPLYVLDDQTALSNLHKGIISEELKSDIMTLIEVHPIVIRMDIKSEEKSKKQMLPRSNEIYNFDDAIAWLKENVKIILGQQEGIFIFHNFVPATSSAFVHAIPNNRIVKIQSLWGLPEGLYYNYHDTIIVDLGTNYLETVTKSTVKVTVKNRYKDLFVLPNKDGKWVTCEIKEPYDWRCSIEDNESIFDMAFKSQKLANMLNEEISVMWFVGIDSSFYGDNNLPWFHEKVSFASYTPDDYKRKYFAEEEKVINCSEEMEELVSSGSIDNIKCIRLKPNCEKDLRNKELIANIGKLAVENGIVILLDGTQLTHSYYQLKATGAKVVCSDKDELLYSDTLEFNKLVRDKIPEKIISNGEHVKCSMVTRPLLDRLLLEKLLEEAYEVNDAESTDDIIFELADLTEICNTLLRLNDELPISCWDILNNKRPFYAYDFNQLLAIKFPTTEQEYIKVFEFTNLDLYGSIYICRQKTSYRVELSLQNYPIVSVEKETPKSHIKLKELKSAIITDVSLALNCRNSKSIVKYINKVKDCVKCLCEMMEISIERIESVRETKALKVGGFDKGYVLNQTTLKDNVIDETIESDSNGCDILYELERDSNKYFELLQDFEKRQKRLLFRFSSPLAVNKWGVLFSSLKIEQVLTDVQLLQFDISKNMRGELVLTVNAHFTNTGRQLSIFD